MPHSRLLDSSSEQGARQFCPCCISQGLRPPPSVPPKEGEFFKSLSDPFKAPLTREQVKEHEPPTSPTGWEEPTA